MSDSNPLDATEMNIAPTDDALSEAPTPEAALPDDQNPAVIDAKKTFIITMVGAALFIGTVFIFIL